MQPLPVPASAGQQALCLLQQVDPFTPGLVLELAFRLGADTDVARLAAALDRLAARHPSLHSVFGVHDGQWTVGAGTPPTTVLDAEPAPLDLVAGPVFQATIVRGSQPRLEVRVHHAVADLWSVGILVTELAALYSGADLPPVSLGTRPERSADRGWKFWRELLAGECAFALPAVPAGPAAARTAVHEPVDLGPERTAAIAATAKRLGITRYGVVLAAQALTLGCIAGASRVPVGVSMHGRTRETRFDVGYHVSTVALPIDIGSGTTTDLVTRTASTLRSAQAHQHLGYPELVNLANAEGLSVPTPQAAVLLQQDTPGAPEGLGAALLGFGTVRIGDLELTAVQAPPSIGPFGLTTLLSDQNGILRGRVEADPARHPAWLAQSVAAILPTAVDVLTGPEIPVREASLVDARQRRDLTVWGTSPMAPVPGATIPHLVLGTARQHPTRVAVTSDDGFLTYAELDIRSASVANGLSARGVGRGDRVGVLMSRRCDLISVLLGILRTGAAYVPLDPGSPPARLAEIADDAGCALVVANRETARKVRGHMSTVDAAELVAAPPTGNGNAVSPDDLAYVLFTSGSTGKPKGVAISHANAVNLIRWAGVEFGPAELAETLAVTPITFDLSVFEMFVPLARGHRVRLVTGVLDLIESAKGEPTLLNTVPSAVSALVERDALPRSLRVLNMAGEPIPAELVARIAEQRPGVRILNLYGPSETTTYSTYTELSPTVTDPVPIGGPVGGTVLRVVDADLNPVPVGAVGELLIGGGGVAMGYLGRSALTASRFLPAEHGKRWYRTGDLVRWRPGGTLDFLGRVDHQVKVRGFRIELGEVEAGLRRVADLREVAVCALRSGADRRLAGYLVPATPIEGDPVGWLRDVRQRLLADLPPHLVPAEFAVLDELPRTPHGKVDRIKLAGLPTTALESSHQVLPRTREERQITEVWARLLDRPSVGVTDDFFALGGHSLVLTKLAAELAAMFGVQVPVAELWNARTPAAQAALLKTLDRAHTAIPRLDRTRFTTSKSGSLT